MPLKNTQINISPRGFDGKPVNCTQLVHDGKKVISLTTGPFSVMTPHTLFCGTAEECAAEITRLNLTPLPTL